MFCEPKEYTYFSIDMLDTVLKYNNSTPTWFVGANGYVACSTKIDNVKKNIYLHQVIINKMNLEKDADKKLSVDHINRNKLDNRNENLRWATQTE